MIFLHPQLLALLALPVILAYWEWVRRGQPIALPFDHGPRRRGLVLRFLVLCANCLPAALLALAIIFLAHPMTFTPPAVERKLTNVQFVLDTSGSMAENHGSQAEGRHRRFDSAMEAIQQFIDYRKGDAFGLTIFSRNYIHWVALRWIPSRSRSRSGSSNQIIRESIRPRWEDTGFRMNCGELLTSASAYGGTDLLCERPDGDRMIILMTDGESSDIVPPLDGPIIERLRAAHITASRFFSDESCSLRSSGSHAPAKLQRRHGRRARHGFPAHR